MRKKGIHIKEGNEGKFGAFARSVGMSVQEAARHVLANKDRYSGARVKQANFARNAAKWNKQDGGVVGSDDRGLMTDGSGVPPDGYGFAKNNFFNRLFNRDNILEEQIRDEYGALKQIPLRKLHVDFANGEEAATMAQLHHNPEYIGPGIGVRPRQIGNVLIPKGKMMANLLAVDDSAYVPPVDADPKFVGVRYPGQYTTLINPAGLSKEKIKSLATNDFVSHALNGDPVYNNLSQELGRLLSEQLGDEDVRNNGGVDAYIRGLISDDPEYAVYREEMGFVPQALKDRIVTYVKSGKKLKRKQMGGDVKTDQAVAPAGAAPMQYTPFFTTPEEYQEYQRRFLKVADRALGPEDDSAYLKFPPYHPKANGYDCINGICGLDEEAGLRWSHPPDPEVKRYLSNKDFLENVRKGREDYVELNAQPDFQGPFEVGDHFLLLGKNNVPHHSMKLLGVERDNKGQPLRYQMIENHGDTRFTDETSMTPEELQDRFYRGDGAVGEKTNNGSKRSNDVIVLRPGKYLWNKMTAEQRAAAEEQRIADARKNYVVTHPFGAATFKNGGEGGNGELGNVHGPWTMDHGRNSPFSRDGYKADSPDRFNAFNIIPSNEITMKGVPHAVMGVDNLGYRQLMMPGAEYRFPGQRVLEVPISSEQGAVSSRRYQQGGAAGVIPPFTLDMRMHEPRVVDTMLPQDSPVFQEKHKLDTAMKNKEILSRTPAQQAAYDKQYLAKQIAEEDLKELRRQQELDRRAKVIDQSDAVQDKYSFFSPGRWSRRNLAIAAQATPERFRLFPDDVGGAGDFFDTYINPAVWVGNLAKGLGQAPLEAQQTNSVVPYIRAVGTPLAAGALGINPVTTITNPIKGVFTSKGLIGQANNLWENVVVSNATSTAKDKAIEAAEDTFLPKPPLQASYRYGGRLPEYAYRQEGAVDETEKQRAWLLSYMQSPMYQERLKMEGFSNPEAEGQARLQNLQNLPPVKYSRDLGSWMQGAYMPREYKGMMFKQGWQPAGPEPDPIYGIETPGTVYLARQYAPGRTPEARFSTTPVHEFSHAVNDGGFRIPDKTIEKIYNDTLRNSAPERLEKVFKPTTKGTVPDQTQYRIQVTDDQDPQGQVWGAKQGTVLNPEDTGEVQIPYRGKFVTRKFGPMNDPSEYLARLDAIRYKANQLGIYDARTQRLDKEVLKKIMADPRMRENSDFQEFYGMLQGDDAEKENKMIDIMNTMASRSNNTETTMARYGGEKMTDDRWQMTGGRRERGRERERPTYAKASVDKRRFQDGGVSYTAPEGYAPSTPEQRANWNQFLNYMESKGVAGSADLDARDKRLGLQYLNEYNKAYPKTQVPESFIPTAQYENYLIRRKNEFPGLTADEAKFAFANLPATYRERPISLVDNWIGTNTSKELYPSYTRDKNFRRNDSTEAAENYNFGQNFEDYVRSRANTELERKYLVGTKGNTNIAKKPATQETTNQLFNRMLQSYQLGGEEMGVDRSGFIGAGNINPFSANPYFTQVYAPPAAPTAAPVTPPTPPVLNDTGLYPYGVINPFDMDPYALQQNGAAGPKKSSTPWSPQLQALPGYNPVVKGFAAGAPATAPNTISSTVLAAGIPKPKPDAKPKTQWGPNIGAASAVVGGLSFLNNILESHDRNRYKDWVRMRNLGDNKGPVLPGDQDNLRGDYSLNEGYFRPQRFVPTQFGAVPMAQFGGGYYDAPAEVQALPEGPMSTLTPPGGYADAGGRRSPSIMPDIKANTRVRPNDQAWEAFDYYVNEKQLAPHVAAGIVGNLYQESGLRTDAAEKENTANGRGIAQWDVRDRWMGLQKWAEKQKRDPYDLYTQLDYVLEEPGEGAKVLKALSDAQTPEEASYVFGRTYERPSDKFARWDVRAGVARKLFEGMLPNRKDMASRGGLGQPNARYGGEWSYQQGGEYEVTEEELGRILAEGGEVEYL
jgi:hypothetical protein